MTGKIKRRSLRCGGRPKADFGSLFTSVIAPAFNAAGSIADESIDNNKTATNGVVNNNTTIPSDPTKTPTMRLGGRKKCWIGTAIGAATSIAGSLFGNSAQKREMRRQKSIQDWQNATQEAANMTSVLNNSRDYQEDYLRQFRTAARLGKTLGAKGIYITDGGDATKIGNNTYLLRGGSHEDVNETGQTGIGINVGGNEVEAEGGEVAQKKNGALRIFSAQPILGNGMSPAQAILRGYNKDKVFSQQQAFKKRNGLKDDGSKAQIGGYYGANYPSPLSLLSVIYDKTLGRFDNKNPFLQTGTTPTPSRGLNLKQVRSGLVSKNMMHTNRVYRITNMREVKDAKTIGQYRKLPEGVRLPKKTVVSKDGRTFSIGKVGGNSHGGKAAAMGEPWTGTTSGGYNESKYIISTPSRHTVWQVGHHGSYSKPLPADAIKKGSGLWKKFDDEGNTGISTKRMVVYKDLGNGRYLRLAKSKYKLGGLTSKDRGSSKHPYPSVSSKDFAGGGRSYPIPTKADAVDALRLAGLHGRSDVRSKVYSKYPSLRPKAAFGDWVRTNRDDNVLADLLYESGLFDRESWNTMLKDIHDFTGMGGNPYNTDDNVDAVMAPAFGVPNQSQIIRNVQQANKFMQAAKASQAAQRIAYAAKEAKDFYRGLGINIPVGRNQIYNPTFRSSEIASKIKDANDALQIYLNNTHLPKGIRLAPVNQGSISRSAARIINPREAEIIRMGIPISQSAKTMTNGANPFLYTPRSSNEILEGLNRVISSAKQGAKNAGQKVGNKLTSSSTYRTPTFAERVRDANGKLIWKQNYKYKPWVKATAGAAGTAGVIGLGIGLSNTNSKSKNVKVQLDAHGKPISQYIARPQTKKSTPIQKSVVIPKQVKKVAPQYKGNTTKGNYQLYDGETRTINGIKYTRRGNAIINHKTNVAYIYDKNGNYTGQADYSKVGNFNQAFDMARAAGRSQFIYRAGKYNNYSTIKESNAKKERLNRIVGARRVAKALGGYSRPVEGMRPKALGGMYIPFNKRYTPIYDAPDYDSVYNGGNVLGNGEVTITAKRIKPTFMKPNNDAMNLIKVPKEEVPYIPQKYNRSHTIFSGGDYLGLGIDTLAALSTGLVNYNTAGKYTLPDRAPIIQASKLPTTYNVNPEIEEIKRYRDRLTGQTFNNTSSSVAALNRSGAINLDALSNLSKLWATKENEENKMLTEDAKNQQTVAAQNVQNELARQSEIARIKNEATQAKGEALNVGLSGLSQAWTNFWTAGRTAYEDDQFKRAMIASSKEATPTRLSEMDFDLSPDILASLYRTSKDDRTKRFYLSRLSPKQRQKYGIN